MALGRVVVGVLRGPGRRVASQVAHELARGAKAPERESAPPKREPFTETLVYYGWIASLAALALVILNVDLVLDAGAPRSVLRLSLGSILLVEGAVLLGDWGQARAHVIRRARRRHASRRPGRRWSGALWSLGLTLAGLVFLGAGVFDLLRGALDL
jgi:hypothetical protein